MAEAAKGADPESTAAQEVVEQAGKRFGAYARIFGSAASVSAFLLFAGYLSDFAAYRLAGVPRLDFNLTALIESGADTLIDAFSLLAGGLRIGVLVAFLAGAILVWANYRSKQVEKWARSITLYRCSRLLVLLLAALLFGALIDRSQRSLSGEDGSPIAIERALQETYSAKFPTPLERRIALDRLGYEVSFFPLPNWLGRFEALRTMPKSDLPSERKLQEALGRFEAVPGIALRDLGESRTIARNVFGWLALTLLLLIGATLFLGWWAEWLNAERISRSSSFAHVNPSTLSVLASDTAVPVQVPKNGWKEKMGAWLKDEPMGHPIEKLVTPISLLLIVLSLCLMPLAHGFLARQSIGSETVLVYLNAEALAKRESKDIARAGTSKPGGRGSQVDPEKPVSQEDRTENQGPSTSGGVARFNCKKPKSEELGAARDNVAKAMRDLIQLRENEDGYDENKQGYADATAEFADQIVAAECGELVPLFLTARPPAGLAARRPEISELYRRSLVRVADSYNVLPGKILAYPRETKSLTLIDTIAPKYLEQGGQWSIRTIEAKNVAEFVVLPNVSKRNLKAIANQINAEPDNDRLKEILVAPSTDALEVSLRLLINRRLYSNGAGVAVTAIGGMAFVSEAERPDLAALAIDALASLVSSKETPWWPNKDDSVRGAAVSALHLAHSPYAAHLLAEMVSKEVGDGKCDRKNLRPLPVVCITTLPTAVGLLLQDIDAEVRLFRSNEPPALLRETRDVLQKYLVQTMTRADVEDEERGLACTGLSLGGYVELTDVMKNAIWQDIRSRKYQDFPASTPTCISKLPLFRLDGEPHREFLREWVRKLPSNPEDELGIRVGRRAALTALARMGVYREYDLLVEAYLNPADKRLGDMASDLLDELAPAPTAALLWKCGGDSSRSIEIRVKCLRGFALMPKHFDGDDGHAEKMRNLAANSLGPIQEAACHAMKSFFSRGGQWLRRRAASDNVIAQCIRS